MADSNNSHKVNYTAIFIALCVCTGISVAADMGKGAFPSLMVGIVMGIACVKATFVLLYFMHIKFESAWKYILLAPTMVLAAALPLALSPDIGFHYYMMQVPQTDLPVESHAGESGAKGHGATESHGHDDHPASEKESSKEH